MGTAACTKRIVSSATTIPTKRCRALSTSSSTSTPSFTDPALEWGRQNPAVAQQCLKIPATALLPTTNHLESLEDYWKWRQWDFSAADDLQHARALVSHVLSAPLTLARFYQQLQQKSLLSHLQQHRWCCVGARAEATLPLGFWKELLVAVAKDPVDISIDFVGPDIHPPKSIPPQRLSFGQHHQLQLNWLYKGYLHDYWRKEESNNNDWTAFILLNPGLGHDNLKEGWKPTLELLSDRPVLLTAHSELDAQRDYELLTQEYGPDRIPMPELNPFASRILYEDPFDASHKVQPNHSVMALWGKDS